MLEKAETMRVPLKKMHKDRLKFVSFKQIISVLVDGDANPPVFETVKATVIRKAIH